MRDTNEYHALWMAARKQNEAAASMKRYFFWLEKKNYTMATECHRRAQLLYRIARDYLGME